MLDFLKNLFVSKVDSDKDARHDSAGQSHALDTAHRLILEANVGFYQALNAQDKKAFESEVAEFLSKVKILGIGTTIEMLDEVLIASSAVIPLFGFPDWFYPNITTVQVYEDSFDHEFKTGTENHILGMVGTGFMNYMMALSKKAVRAGFIGNGDKRNTGVHEFVHLIDKSDGSTDGIPEILIQHNMAVPWLKLIREEIEQIRKGESDIDVYGATNEAEFFAVAGEYFFERPDLMATKHPELFALMEKAFRRKPVVDITPDRKEIGRNDPCPCGSGKKYKNCHGASGA